MRMLCSSSIDHTPGWLWREVHSPSPIAAMQERAPYRSSNAASYACTTTRGRPSFSQSERRLPAHQSPQISCCPLQVRNPPFC